ncbi:TPA: hypothetical protein ACGVAZ_004242 [Vibrio vulnificus]|uniref:hypothetical protein n=1 Tax=Vibrio vulnificus TaxID=672 RepID=UPI001D378185|nr:hypothetical protein [Vibrio vulnificus]EHK9184208.1 hypothetical protein [Vibrio vulnificus]EHZ2755521.1 hypothetical protein [Vibrio vulnificus]EHZ2763731.1 hypothetical protein [Vibrio vulnificus]EIJ0981508.1 hypothetical protein [Vibrio vulnificus]EKD8804197.1 hypothetical protein [Vibrio vulnificus]
MKWKKLGLIFDGKSNVEWHADSALTPTPFKLNDEVIRVYAGFRDAQGASRIGYVDVLINDPAKVVKVSDKPCLDLGENGCFDDNGVILGDVVRHGSEIRMYYVGFQLVKKAKFLAYSGLAVSHDGGETFERVKQTPILDRSDDGLTINAIHTALYENGVWKFWYAVGSGWENINGVDYPQYHIKYTESKDGINFSHDRLSVLCVDNEGTEYRIGRPSVYKLDSGYLMFYTKGSTSGEDYYPGVAYSDDGINWQRRDQEFGLELSSDGFDSRHLCYPRLINVGDKVLCFYNGNDMGKHGFGLAELESW